MAERLFIFSFISLLLHWSLVQFCFPYWALNFERHNSQRDARISYLKAWKPSHGLSPPSLHAVIMNAADLISEIIKRSQLAVGYTVKETGVCLFEPVCSAACQSALVRTDLDLTPAQTSRRRRNCEATSGCRRVFFFISCAKEQQATLPRQESLPFIWLQLTKAPSSSNSQARKSQEAVSEWLEVKTETLLTLECVKKKHTHLWNSVFDGDYGWKWKFYMRWRQTVLQVSNWSVNYSDSMRWM